MSGPAEPDHGLRAVLSIRPFRSLWLCLGLSSFGDWLGLLATTAMAAALGAGGGGEGAYASANLAVSGVLVLRLAPAILFGPLAGAIADRWDRKATMVVGDVLRGALFVSIPVVGTLWWLFTATLLIEVVALFWAPAKDATVPNLVPRERLEAANQLSLAVTYGTAPLAALLFSALALVSRPFEAVLSRVDLALYANAATYLVAAVVVAGLPVPRGTQQGGAQQGGAAGSARRGVLSEIVEGWRFVATTPLIRGLVIGMLGAFGAGGFVIGVAPSFVTDLQAGEPGYGVLFAAVFTGLALGMWTGPRVLAAMARWRLFALAIIAAGVALLALALIPQIVIVAGLAVVVGACGGVAWVTGYTMLGLEVADELRGRTFAFVQSAARVVLVGVLALAPALAALFGRNRIQVTETTGLDYNGAALTLVVAAVVAIGIGVFSYRQMDDGRSDPLVRDLVSAWRRRHAVRPRAPRHPHPGTFVAVEGGDGTGKSTQVRLMAAWLAERGHDVVATREPGATPAGRRIREVLLHGDDLAPRAEALLYAADRAHHVDRVVLPALRRGQVVVTDRYIDSSLAYQGAGRALDVDEVAGISHWATGDLLPDVTVLLDLDPARARARTARMVTDPDRREREPEAFHAAVRQRFLDLARADARRYVVVDADAPVEEVARRVREQLEPRLPALRPAAVDGGPAADPGAASAGVASTAPATDAAR